MKMFQIFKEEKNIDTAHSLKEKERDSFSTCFVKSALH